ncbi:helix-turn-helix domain-containing protein [Neobacillus piezotolerans]|uniref:helix-turn-helix domain-containing protein n=1 Tax=Neobacillus piezotolerans TaxID=2259171 RepID=UPI0015F13FDE|nr:helix-turn-helix transcriptional regulator [Neobacillus piezotolerans]
MDINDFGSYIKKLRKDKGLTLAKLAELSGVSHPYISQIENGKLKSFPSSEVLIKLAKHLGVHYALLLLEAGYIAKGTIMTDGQLLVTEGSYIEARKEIESMDPDDNEEHFYLDLANILNLPEISYKDREVTTQDRELIKVYLDTLFASRLKED